MCLKIEMPQNVEIKAKVDDLDVLLACLKRIEGDCEKPVILIQSDTFFKSVNGRLKLREFLDSDGKCKRGELIYYDRPDVDGPKISNFVRTEVSDVEGLKAALTASLTIIGKVKKRRTLVMYGQTRIHIDEVEGLGNYMELEVCLRDEQSLEDGEKIAKEIMILLNVSKESLMRVPLFFAFMAIGLAALVSAEIKSVAVKGTLLCGKNGAENVRIRLLRNKTEAITDILDYRITSDSGMFHLEGNNIGRPTNETELLPNIRFYHNCDEDVKKTKGHRTFSMNVPSDFVTLGRKPRKTYDLGTLNLQVIMPKEKREKNFKEP